MDACASCFNKFVLLWRSTQVELHGQYSIKRLYALRQFIAATSAWQAIAFLLLSLLPSLCVLLGLDALPVASPEAGFSKQTPGLWVRNFVATSTWAIVVTVQVCEIEPSLPMTRRRLALIAFVGSAVTVWIHRLLMHVIGFPVPFAFQLLTAPFLASVCLVWWLCWKETLRGDPIARVNVLRYMRFNLTLCAAYGVYIGYKVAYDQLREWPQVAFSALLPLLKLLFKNVTSNDLYCMEDLAPVLVVSSIDVFHTLFISLTMQQTAASSITLGIVMTMDVLQNAVAVYKVRKIVARLNELNTLTSAPVEAWKAEEGCLFRVAWILGAGDRLRQKSIIADPRHVRDLVDPPPTLSARYYCCRNSSAVKPVGLGLRLHDQSIRNLERKLHEQGEAQPVAPLSETMDHGESAQLEYIQKTLKLLHMTEFYVLLEFVEVMIATVYATYLFALSYMPNRVYYPQFAALGGPEMRSAAAKVAAYAVMELVSLLVFFAILAYLIQGYSPLRQLAFALRTQWRLHHAMVVLWVLLVVQISFKHNGADFTFQFKWLNHKHGKAPP